MAAAARDRSSPDSAVGSARASSSDSGRPRLRLIREHLGARVPSGPLTEKTVKYMAQMIRRAARDPLLARAAEEVKANAQKTGEPVVVCLWWWVKYHVHFLHHDKQICQMFGECAGGGNYQLLIEPSALLRLRSMEGDCAVFTMLIDALAVALGFEVRIATIEADRRRPGEYSHVYGEVYLADSGQWCPLDASHGTGPGWEVPARDIARKTEWSLDGEIVADWRQSSHRADAISVQRSASSNPPMRPAASSGLADRDEKGGAMPYVRSYRYHKGGAQPEKGGWPTRRTGTPGDFTISTEMKPGVHSMEAYVEAVRGMGQDTWDPSPGDYLPGGGVLDTGGDFPTVDTWTQPGAGSPIDWSKLATAIGGSAATATQLYRSLQSPGLVPGTNAIFNPATGQFYNPMTGQVVNPTGVTPTSNVPLAGLTSSPMVLVVGGVAVLAVLLVALRKN